MTRIRDLTLEKASEFSLRGEILVFAEEDQKAYVVSLEEFKGILSHLTKNLIKIICKSTEKNAIESMLRTRSSKIITYDTQLEIAFTRDPLRIRFKKPLEQAKIKVLIVDDSPTVQKLLKSIIQADPQLEVVGSCGKPSDIEGAIKHLEPDIMTLDIHMPEMNGIEFLKAWPLSKRIPTILISSLSKQEGPLVLEGLENGALDYVHKPSLDNLTEVGQVIVEKLKLFGRQKSVDVQNIKKVVSTVKFSTDQLVVIGASTGGTEALKVLLTALPADIPPILIVQHIPAVFSEAFAQRLNSLCAFKVKEAKDGDEVVANQVLIAPGGFHMELKKSGPKWTVRTHRSNPVNRHRPSVDVLFDSAVKNYTGDLVGVLLTGMGADGAQGLLKIKEKGFKTIAQSERTCVVFGMPREAVKIGAATHVLDLQDIPIRLIESLKSKKGAA